MKHFSFSCTKESILGNLSVFVLPIVILITCNHIDGGEFGVLSGIFILPILMWPFYPLYLLVKNEASQSCAIWDNSGDPLGCILMVDICITGVLMVFKIPYSWVPLLLLIIDSVMFALSYKMMSNNEQKSRLTNAQYQADELEECLNKWLEVCPECGLRHKLRIKTKIINNRVVFRVFASDNTFAPCRDVEYYIYHEVYWLEKEVNDYDGFKNYTW